MKIKTTYLLSMFLIFLSSVCIFLMSFFLSDETKMGRNIVAIIFYICTLFGYLTFFLTDRKRKSEYKSDISMKERLIKHIVFFSNKYALIADVIFLISIIGTIIVIVTAEKANFIHFFIISLFFFSANAHFMLNGENFKYIYIITKKRGMVKK